MNFWQWYGREILKVTGGIPRGIKVGIKEPCTEGTIGIILMVSGVAIPIVEHHLWFLLLIPLGITLMAHATWRYEQKARYK